MSICKLSKCTLVVMLLGTFSISNGNEPSALELKQMQTRIFKTHPEKVHSAMIELCRNAGGSIFGHPWSAPPAHSCSSATLQEPKTRIEYSLSKERDGATLIRIRLEVYRHPHAVQIKTPADYDSVFKSLADMLVLNEMGVELKVFR